MEPESIILTVESTLDQLLDQKWIHPSVNVSDKLQIINNCIIKLNTLLKQLSYDSKYQILNGNTIDTHPLCQILSKIKHQKQVSIQNAYWSIIDILIIHGADISVPLSTEYTNYHQKISFGIYHHIKDVMNTLNYTQNDIIDKILYITNLWYKCKLTLYQFNLSSYPSVVTFTNNKNMLYLNGVYSTMPSNDIIYRLFCNGFQVFNAMENNNNLTNKKKWSDLGLIFMVYLNYKQNMSDSLRFELQHNHNILPYENICDIIDDYQFGSTSKIYSQIVSDNQWIVFALKYIYSHPIKWKVFLMENILLNENILKPKEFKLVQAAIEKWDVHTFFWSQWLKEETNLEILKFYLKFYNGIWENVHFITLINKYLYNEEMMKYILSNCRYKYDKVWFEKPLLLMPPKRMKKIKIMTKSINTKSTLLYDLLIKRDISNNDKILKHIIDHLIDLKNGNIENVSYEETYYVHKMFIDLYSMFVKQFRETDQHHVIWNNMKYLLLRLKESGNKFNHKQTINNNQGYGEWNKKLDIDYGLYEAFMCCNTVMIKFLINSNIIDMQRCLEMGYLNKMFKLLLQTNKKRKRYNYGNKHEMSERNLLRIEMLPLIIDALLKCGDNNEQLQSYLLQWLNLARNCNNTHCVNILSSAISVV